MSNTVVVPKGTRRISAEEMKKMRIEGNRKVKGIFRCFEPMGGSMKFCFKKFPGDPVETYDLKDGEIYELPMMVARHLKNGCNYPVHSHILDADGNPRIDVGRNVQRCTFEGLDFMDVAGDDS